MSVTFSATDTLWVDTIRDGDYFTEPAEGYTIVNMSNVNASALLESLDICSKELYGVFEVDDLSRLIVKIEELQKQTTLMKAADYVANRLAELHTLFTEAISRGVEVTYA